MTEKDSCGLKETMKLRVVSIVLTSIILPVVVMLLGLIALHITPFGNHSLAISDAKWYLNGQLFTARLLNGQENFLYTFNSGIGGNEWAALAWGGITIGGLLSLFGTLETMPAIYTWICVTNIAVCGLSMYILLAHERGHHGSNLIFSTSYALMGFNIAYCHETLFFWGPQMLPLVILGLLRILRGKGPLPYVISLALCTFFDFYFAFHLGIASALILVAYAYANRGTFHAVHKRTVCTWFASSIIAVFIAAPMWLPALKAYSGGGRLDQTTLEEFSFSENMPFIQIFSKLFSGAFSLNEMVAGLPNIFCGILIVALVILYFIHGGIDLQRKRAAGSLLIVYVLSFYITFFTIAMHGGTHTNWFPYRYSYVFSFLMIALAAELFTRLEEVTLIETKKVGALLLGITILVFATKYEFISGGSVILDFALLIAMWAALRFHKNSPERAPKRVLTAFLLLIVCANLYVNFIATVGSMQEWELDMDEYQKNTIESGALVEAVSKYDSTFYRMEKDKSESGSVGADPSLYNYNGVSHSGPTERMFIHKGLNKLGVNWFDMRHWYSEGIPAATDCLLGLKYIISDRDLAQEKNYERLIAVEDQAVFKNENTLGVAILVDNDINNVEVSSNAFKNLNSIWKAMTGGDRDVFVEQADVTFNMHNPMMDMSITSGELKDSVSQTELKAQEESVSSDNVSTSERVHSGPYIEYSFLATQSGPVYMFDTSVPDSERGIAANSMKYCGVYEEGQEVKGTLDVNGPDYVTADFLRGYCANLVFAYADNQVLASYAKELNCKEITLNAEKENDLTGQFIAGENQQVLFTLPWDESWTLYVDGSRVPLEKTWDLFMSAEVPDGEHTYEMRFSPAWMNVGIGLSGGAILSLIALVAASNIRKRQLVSHE